MKIVELKLLVAGTFLFIGASTQALQPEVLHQLVEFLSTFRSLTQK